MDRPDRPLRAFPGQACRGPQDAGRLPEVRLRFRPHRRAARHLRLPEDGRRYHRRQLPADAGAIHQRRQSRQPGGQLRPAGNPRRPGREDEDAPGRQAAGPLSPPAGATAPLQAAHVREKGREAPGDADGDGPGRRQDVPPAQRCRLAVRPGQGRKGPLGPAQPRLLLHAASLTQAERPQDGLSQVLPPVCRSPAHARRHARRGRPARRLLRKGPQLRWLARGRPLCGPHAGGRLR